MRELVEVWKPVVGWEDRYMVSSLGRVKSLDRYLAMPNGGEKLVKGRITKQYKKPNGYMSVILGRTHNDRKNKYIHRLVAEAFPEICGEWFEKCEVDHINTIREDNRAINLKVCTAYENANNPLTLKHQSDTKIGKKMPIGFGEKISNIMKGRTHTDCTKDKIRKALSKPIIQFTLDGELVRKWDSTRDVEKVLNISHSSITQCCKNKYGYKSAGGSIWKYYDTDTYLIALMNKTIKDREKRKVA